MIRRYLEKGVPSDSPCPVGDENGICLIQVKRLRCLTKASSTLQAIGHFFAIRSGIDYTIKRPRATLVGLS